MSLGQRLIELRKTKQLSQEEVEERLNVTRQTVSKWETDQSSPEFDKILPLCELYEVSTDELLTGRKEEEEEKEIFSNPVDNNKKRTIGLVLGILLYFISIAWIMVSIPVLDLNPILSTAGFIVICGVATCVIIYTRIVYKKEAETPKEKEDKLYKQLEEIGGLLALIIYLVISFKTGAWHITWIIWLIYPLIMAVIKLILSLRGK
jgi:transcriptional regulator with XRE-family HTH domain